jgi:hypothetical protein
MSSVDERVVDMKFNNSQFQKGTADTMKSLDDLKKGLNLDGAAKSLAGLDDAGKRFSLAHISNGVDTIASKFSALSVIGITALATITQSAIAAGAQLVKSLTIAPISEGFADYNAKLTSVQTIMNATGKDISTVSGYFGELDTYADKTIYNLTDMTGAFAKFTNAGIDMDQSVPAIKGIANMVALAGQDAGAASIAMYNLSQSLAGGFLTTTDYKSLNLANVATKEWKNQMIEGAIAAGTLKKNTDGMYTIKDGDKAYTDAALFNEALSEGWASAGVLIDVLGDYGDTTTVIGAKAQSAAQDVKSWGMMLETLSAGVGTSWTDTFELILGDVEQSKSLFTPMTAAIGGVLDELAAARNIPLKQWNELGGRDGLIQAGVNSFNALKSVIGPIKDAMTDIFPPITGETLLKITNGLRDFTAGLILSEENSENLRRTFRGVFAVFDIVWMVISGVVGVIAQLIGTISGGTGSVLEFTGGIGDFLVSLRDAIKNGEGLSKFFSTLGTILQVPLLLLGMLGSLIKGLFDDIDGVDLSGASSMLDTFFGKFDGFGAIGERVRSGWETVKNIFNGIKTFFAPFVDNIKDQFGTMFDTLGSAFSADGFNGVLDAINVGLLGGIVLLVKKFLDNGLSGFLGEEGGGFKDQIKEILGGMTGALEAMQTNLKAGTLLKIAAAVGILAISAVALSMVDSVRLAAALGAMTVMFGQLAGAMVLLEKVAAGPGIVKLPIIVAAMILLSIAINILAIAVGKLSGYSWEELAKGLSAVAVMMGIMVGASKLLETQSAGMIRSGIAMILMATGLNILAKAVGTFSGMSWEDMAKGLLGAAVAMGGLVFAMSKVPPNIALSAVGLLIASAALLVLSQAIKSMGEMSWGEFAVAMATLAGSLAILAGGLTLMVASLPGAAALVIASAALLVLSIALSNMGKMSWEEVGKAMVVLAGSLILLAAGLTVMAVSLPGAAALVIAAGALIVLAIALEQFGDMSWEEIGKAMVVLAGSLLILAVGLTLMIASLPGAAALVVAAGALAILAPVLKILGSMGWDEIGRGLTVLAAALTIIGIAGILILPAIPGLILLGVAVTLLGVGLLAAGAGILAFSIGITALSLVAGTLAATITVIISAIIAQIPAALEALAQGIILFAQTIAQGGPAFVAAMTTVLLSILTAINTNAPAIVQTLMNLLMLLVNTLVAYVPVLATKGADLIIGLLNGIASRIGGIITAATNLIVAFLNGIANNLPRVIQAGINLIISFIQGLADGINRNAERMRSAGKDLAFAIIDGMTGGLLSGASRAIQAAKDMAGKALQAAKDALGIASPSKEFTKVGGWSAIGMANGISNGAGKAVSASKAMATDTLDAMKSAMSRISDMVSNEMDMTPTIQPVLDLSAVQKEARNLNGLFDPEMIAAAQAYAQSAAYEKPVSTSDDSNGDGGNNGNTPTEIKFEQNNYSPKPLSRIDLYRQTKNLVSSVKDVPVPK